MTDRVGTLSRAGRGDPALPQAVREAKRAEIGQTIAAAGSAWGYPKALLVGVLITGVFLAILLPHVYLFREDDATAYLEAARNLLDGRGLAISSRTYMLSPVTEPISLWPPGFPWLLAGASRILGVDPASLGPPIAWACWALLPAASLFALRRALSDTAALTVGALAAIAPGAIDYAWQPMTDGPFLLLSVITLGLLSRALDRRLSTSCLVASAVLTGLAYCLRNAALGLAMAAALTFVAMALLGKLPVRAAIWRVSVWGGFASFAASPVLIRNLWVFRELQPYHMRPSHLGVWANIRYFAASLVNNFVSVHGLDHFLVWRGAFLGAAVLAPALGFALLRKRLWGVWRGLSAEAKGLLILLSAYFVSAAAVVIAARARYEMGDLIGDRYVWQCDWPLLAAAAILLTPLLVARRRWPFAVLLLAGLVGFRLFYAYEEVRMDQAEHSIALAGATPANLASISSAMRFDYSVDTAVANDRPLIQALKRISADSVIVSDNPGVLRVETGRPALYMKTSDGCDPRAWVRAMWNVSGDRTKVAVVLLPMRSLLELGVLGVASAASWKTPAWRPIAAVRIRLGVYRGGRERAGTASVGVSRL